MEKEYSHQKVLLVIEQTVGNIRFELPVDACSHIQNGYIPASALVASRKGV